MLNNPSNVTELKALVIEAVEISKILYTIFKGKNKKNNI